MNEAMIYTVQEVAKIIHTSPNYVYKLIEKGYLPAIKLGSIKVLKTTLEQFLIENQGKDFTNLDSITRLNLAGGKLVMGSVNVQKRGRYINISLKLHL